MNTIVGIGILGTILTVGIIGMTVLKYISKHPRHH